jgi:Holliday junction DNA helicase RuvA
VELREKVAEAPEGTPITVSRGDDPRLLARDGLVGLGFSPPEAQELLEDAPPDLESAEEIVAHALRAARR